MRYLYRLIHMQLARLSIFADTSIIVNAIGCVGILLHLCQKNPLADCVQGARLNKEQIAFFYWNTVDNSISVPSAILRRNSSWPISRRKP